MSTRSRLPLRLLAAAAFAVAAVAAAPRSSVAAALALVGPPWISIEVPGNPYDATTRGAYLIVHAFHHGTPVAMPVSGTAEGMVNGERRTVPLRFTTTSRPGTFALAKQWGDGGVWTLDIIVTQGRDDVAQALVEIGTNGQVAGIRVPTRNGGREGFPMPGRVTAQEIDSTLRARARTSVAARQ
jgi:hypothetical protein